MTPNPHDWHYPPPDSNGHCTICGGPSNGKNPSANIRIQHRQTDDWWEIRKSSNTGWVYSEPKRPKPPAPPKPPPPVKEPEPLPPQGHRFTTLLRPRKRKILTPKPFDQCRAYGYTRYSHEEERDPHNRPEYQLKEIEAFYKLQSPRPQWGRFFHDECSGHSYDLEDRPAGADLLNVLEPGDWLIIFHPYRLGRRMDDVMSNVRFLRRTNVTLKIVTIPSITDWNTPIGDITLFGMALGAQLQSESISQYTKAAMKRLKDMGRVMDGRHRVPYGCKLVVRGETRRKNPAYWAVEDPELIEQYRMMYEKLAEGYSYREIVDAARQAGWTDASGRAYEYNSATGLCKVLQKTLRWYAQRFGELWPVSRPVSLRPASASSPSAPSRSPRPGPPPSLEFPAAEIAGLSQTGG